MNADVTRVELRVGRLEKIVDGNGEPGLKADVAVMKRDVPEILKRVSRMEKVIYAAGGAAAVLFFLFELWVKR